MTFTHVAGYTPLQLKTTETGKGRFYTTPTGNKYASITTILGTEEKPGIAAWRESLGKKAADIETKRAADRGTYVHSAIECFLNNDPTYASHLETMLESKRMFFQMRSSLKKINNILMQEGALYSDTLRTAGRVDCVGEYNGKLAIIDFKSSTRIKTQSMIADYFLQTTAYALMFEEIYNVQIDDIVVLMGVEKGIGPLTFCQPVEPYIEPLLRRIDKYYTK